MDEEEKTIESYDDTSTLEQLALNDSKKLDSFDPVAKIVVVGVGGAGNNAVNRMIEEGIQDVRFAVLNTDTQALATSRAPIRMILGDQKTHGLGAGGNPARGKEAAEESIEKIKALVKGADMVFSAAGMGKGTGTGASPIVAKCAKEAGALTVAIVTRPFAFEGPVRVENAVKGLNALKDVVDSVIIVSNDKLLRVASDVPVDQAFAKSDGILAQSVKTITELILYPSMINLDFADVKTTLEHSGVALIGFGMGSGPNKAEEAAENAVNSDLLEASISGARRAICAVTCGSGVRLMEAQQCVKIISDLAGNALDIKFSVNTNPSLGDSLLVSVIASDFKESFDFTKTPTYDDIDAFQEKAKEEEETVKESDIADAILPNFLKDKIS